MLASAGRQPHQRARGAAAVSGAPAAARALLLVVVGPLAALNVALALLAVLRPDEVRYGEAILYAHASRLLQGQALYQPLNSPPYSIATYTPLGYVVLAGLRALLGPGFWPGRALSCACGLLSAVLVGRLAWRRSHARWPALLSGLLFVALGLAGPIPWFGSYKEDLLGLALSLAAIDVLDADTSRGPRRAALGGLLAGGALLTKQTLVGPALLGSVYLWRRQRRLAGVFGGLAFGSGLVVAGWLELTTHAFVADTLTANLNPWSADQLRSNLVVFALLQVGPLLVAAAYLGPRLRAGLVGHDLLAGAWLVSLLPMLALAKVGADYNYWLLFAAITAVAAVLASWRWRARLLGSLAALILALNALVALVVILDALLAEPRLVWPGPTANTTFADLVAETRAAPGPVLADPLDLPALAERPITLEPILYRLLDQVGLWDPRPLVEQVCDGKVSLLVLGYPLGSDADAAGPADRRWPAPVLRALRSRFMLQTVIGSGPQSRFVYVPAPPAADGLRDRCRG